MSILLPARAVDACNISADNTFGPIVLDCRREFDFTLLFEQAIFSIGPSALVLAILHFHIAKLLKQCRKTEPNVLRYAKLVSYVLSLHEIMSSDDSFLRSHRQ